MGITESIPTKFTAHDVRNMDKLVKRGIYISRSDIIRTATRNTLIIDLKKETEYDKLVKTMKEKGDFDNLEGKVLSRILLEQKHLSIKDFNMSERKIVRKLIRHPAGLIKTAKGKFYLTGFGDSAARGYIKGLTHAKTLF